MDSRILMLIGELLTHPQSSGRLLDPLLKLEKEIVKEGLDFGPMFPHLLYVLSQAYLELKNLPKHEEYLKKWVKIKT